MTMVYAVRVHKLGGPEELRYEQVEVGEPGYGEARVRHTVIGLNFTDIHFRTGRYPLPSLPHVIGMEAAGVLEAVGADVTAFRVGDRVAYAAATPGAYAQATVMPVKRLVKLPDFIDDEAAAATLLKGLTAQYLIRSAYTI
jgi:NADPH2:quinone reductase